MKIKNNRKNFVVLQLNDGVRKKIQKFKPSEVIDLPYFNDMKQVVNKFLFTNGNLSVVTTTTVIAPKEEKPKAKKSTTKKVAKKTTKKATSKKSKIEEAIEGADNFVAGDVNKDGVVDGEDLSIVHKDYSKENKSKNK